MRARLLILPVFLASMLLFGACSSTEKPDPSDTLSGGRAGGIGTDSIVPENVYGNGMDFNGNAPFGDGLTHRDADGDLFSGEQLKGLLQPVYFGFDQSNVSASETSKLQQAAAHLVQNPNDRLIIEGHCDWRGTSEYNLSLGERRAQSVQLFLENLGIPSHRMRTNSKGDEEAAVGGTESQMAQDRRAELIIVR
jgi:peptidoglycan-associated lipoprotein